MAEGYSIWDILFGGSRKAEEAQDLNAAKSEALYNLLTGQGNMNPQQWLSSSQNLQGNLQDLYGQLATGQTATQDFSQASSLADQALSELGTSYRDLAKQQSQNAVRQMEASMGKGGLFSTASGGVASALQTGALQPLLEAETNLAAQKSAASQNLFNQLLGSRQTALSSGIQLNQNQQNMANALLSLLGQQSEQAWQPAQYEQTGGIAAPLLSIFGFGSKSPKAPKAPATSTTP